MVAVGVDSGVGGRD